MSYSLPISLDIQAFSICKNYLRVGPIHFLWTKNNLQKCYLYERFSEIFYSSSQVKNSKVVVEDHRKQ